MIVHQSMSGKSAQTRIDAEAQKYAAKISSGEWPLDYAHEQLKGANLDLFKIAGLAKAIACFQCSVE